MNKVIPDLYPGTVDPAVADLHDALLALLQRGVLREGESAWREWFIQLRPERAEQLYGDVTHELVVRFQREWQLGNPEYVDEPTAQTMNDLLRGFGLLDGTDADSPELVQVLGTHTRTLNAINAGTDRLISIDQKIGVLGQAPTLSLTMRGEMVTNLHKQLDQIGVALPAKEQEEGIFGTGTRDAVLQLQAKYDLIQSGVFDDATRNALEIAAGNIAHPRRVEGRIFLENGLPAAKIKLRIVHKGFEEDAIVLTEEREERVEEIETDESGFYTLSYTLDGPANLEVQAKDTSGNFIRLSTPKVNADHHEALNLVAPLAVQAQSSEFKLMTADLTPVIGEDMTRLALVREDDGHQLAEEVDARQDLSMLHESTGWDARLLATAAKAAQDSKVTGITQDALYGALRAGLPDDPEALAMVSPEAFEAALTRAHDAGVIALGSNEKADATKEFAVFALHTRRNIVVPGALSSAGEMLDKAPVSPAHRETFEQLTLLHDGDDAELWQKAEDRGIAKQEIAALQLQGKLAYLTMNNAPLVGVLQNEIESQDQLELLVEKDLYKPEPWAARLDALATPEDGELDKEKLATLIPAAYSQADVYARRDAYAQDLASKVGQAFPTQVINREIENKELKLGAQHAELKAPVQTFLQNAAERGFQLGRVPVEQFIKQHGDVLFDGWTEENKVRAETGAKLLARAYQMTPNDEAMTTLLDLGFTSAYQVTSMPKSRFVEQYWEHFGSRKVTELVWEKSSQITSVTFGLYTMAKKLDSTPPLMAISGSPQHHHQAKDALKNLLKEYPTMESLFGSLDFCECEHCHSVLSPAAYLVDLLRFIDPPAQEWELTLTDWHNKRNGREYQPGWDKKLDNTPRMEEERKPYDALIERRPDLPHIPLTCENTNTALPYIDLVNEILEFYVYHTNLDETAARDTGEANSAELIAEPHNVIPEAYDRLKEARYPLTLPFDLWLETARRFCEYFETPLWQVLDVFRPSEDLYAPAEEPKAYYRADIFIEYLGLSPDEYAIFTSDNFDEWPKLYGYDGNDALAAEFKLKSAKTLSRRLGVSYKELAMLVQTEFINPKLAGLVMLRKLGVSVSEVLRYKQSEGYEELTAEEKTEFEKRLAQTTNKYKKMLPDFNAKQWLNDAWVAQEFDKVLLLRDPNAGCDFDETSVVYSDADKVDVLDFVKLNLFVRLWKRLGWTIEEIDRALVAFLPAKDDEMSEIPLGETLKSVLIYMAHLKELEGLVSVGRHARLKLLTLWADLPAKGGNSLYAQLFLTRNILKDDAIFDDPFGNYLSKSNVRLKDHLPAVQAALTLTADEIVQILQDGNTENEAEINKAALSMANVSLLYRYGLLAKGLKLTIAELISLKALTGLDPFHQLEPGVLDAIKKDHPLEQTIAFVHHAQRIKESALTISDLNYLFRHEFDPNGKYREDRPAQLAWIRTLATELRTIAEDYVTPANGDELSDDTLKQKMLLVFAPDVVETFMGFWLDKNSVIRENVPPDKHLPAMQYSLPDVTVFYDETRQLQHVTHIGVLIESGKDTLMEQIPHPAPDDQNAIDAREMFAELLDQIVEKSKVLFRRFFDQYFDGQLKFEDFFEEEADTPLAQKRLKMLEFILPFLRDKLLRQTIVQTMAAQTGADPVLVESLLTNAEFLALPEDPDLPLLIPLLNWFAEFAKLKQGGITAETFASVDLNADPHTATEPDIKTVPDIKIEAEYNINSARWYGYFEVPQGGAYRFYAKLGKKDAAVVIRLDGVLEPLLNATATKNDDEVSGFIALKPGALYSFAVEATNLQNGAFRMMVKGETTAKSALSQFTLLPHSMLDSAIQAYTMLSKAVQIVQALGLSAREVRHILMNSEDFGNVDWRQLPTQSDDANTVSLFEGLHHLQQYTALNRDWGNGGDDVIAILEQTRLKTPPGTPELCNKIAAVTRRKPSVVEEVATELQFTEPGQFAAVKNMARLWQALQVVERFGVRMASLKKWLTPRPNAAVAQDIRHTIKARYEPETWQRIAKSIFDPLRQRQRDALVAHIMHLNPQLDSVEKLFEYFLIDPGMEPVVQTSRIRLAISSLQTFIQRCFLNLEEHVHPSVLNAQHWAWMKRYRIWEANRKIFLFRKIGWSRNGATTRRICTRNWRAACCKAMLPTSWLKMRYMSISRN
jgi:peptidoglycan hydrolase-like protein with peptidoglycan-binding domain